MNSQKFMYPYGFTKSSLHNTSRYGESSDYGAFQNGGSSDYATQYRETSSYGAYSVTELERARNILSQARDNGSLKWLNKKLQRYPMGSGSRNFVPNIWEGQEGMMEHIHQTFPMPPSVPCNQELPVAKTKKPDSLHSDRTSSSPSQPRAESYSKVIRSSSVDRVNVQSTDAKDIQNTPRKPSHGNYTKGTEEELFWVRVTVLYHQMDNMPNSLAQARKKLCSGNSRIKKEGCVLLAEWYAEIRKLRMKIKKAQIDFVKNNYRNIFALLSFQAKEDFKNTHGLEGLLPVTVYRVLKKCEKLRAKFRELIETKASVIKPHKSLLSVAYEDFAADQREEDYPFSETSESEL